ncbi:uncharacterized membrane-anchored protein YitT (DUF2179 family) [Peptoniphilus olsenii]|uniref:Uncharacterized membrane-anchored protein YitT (DUF2179 family) n=1 Tax=Peptoniphilus olsenii TaxID=411570 RepID=A0ABV2J8P1_9FIRM
MNNNLKNWIFSKTFFVKLMSVIVCMLFTSFSMVVFIKANNLISGGLAGLSLLFNSITGIDLPIIILILNAPTFILSIIFLDRDFAFFSGISVLFLSFFVSLIEKYLPGFYITKQPLLGAIFGGLLNGIGAGIAFMHGTSTGGLDIIAAILKKYFNITIGSVLMGLNFIIVCALAFIYTPDQALYTLILMYFNYTVIDRIQLGVGIQKQIFIISEKYDEIVYEIYKEINRGATFIKGKTAYKKKDLYIAYVICSSRQLVKVRQIVKRIDPEAFMAVNDTSEILGKGFKELSI